MAADDITTLIAVQYFNALATDLRDFCVIASQTHCESRSQNGTAIWNKAGTKQNNGGLNVFMLGSRLVF